MRFTFVGGACAAAALLAGLSPAAGASLEYTTTHATTGDAPVSLTMNGETFVNQGLVGAGRLSATLKDFMGTSLGSFSGMAIDRNTWRKVGDSYTGTLYTLPDRGYNTDSYYSNYQGRLVQFDLSFTPYSGADLPAATTSQSQISLTPTGSGIALTDFNGTATTGFDPGTGTITENGYLLPYSTAAGRVPLDAEALAFLPDGSFYVGDEYSGGVYLFDASGKMKGFIAPVAALVPMTDGVVDYNSTSAPDTGRRNNQGIEAVSITPDGKKLVEILQSATLQDSDTSDQSDRTNTRILIYDISTTLTPTAPVEHYVLQLPIINDKGNGKATNKTAAQSEVLAINDSQFLVLSRDGAGYGTESNKPEVYKSILLVDTNGATNLAGTEYETTTKPVSDGRVLDPSITPVEFGELVNMLNTTQLARFGLNIDTSSPKGGTNLTLSEKWEAMALLPALDEAHPQDFFLFVGNDNDFLTTDGVMPDGYTYDAGLNNDSMLLAYRLTLPTAVDPLFEQAMIVAGGAAMASVDQAVFGAADAGQADVAGHLTGLRTDALLAGKGKAGDTRPVKVWVSGTYDWDNRDADTISTDATNYGATAGIDFALAPTVTVGGAVGTQGGRNEPATGFRTEYSAYAISAYGQYSAGGLSVSGSYSFVPLSFGEIRRPGAFGTSAAGSTEGRAHVFAGEASYLTGLGGFSAGPLATISHVEASVDGYTEEGGAGGNVVYPDRNASRSTAGFGAEAVLPLTGVALTGRALYNWVFADDDGTAALRLASVGGSAGGATVNVPSGQSDSITLGLRAQGEVIANVGWFVGYDLDISVDGGTANTVSTGFSVGF
ncbi:esterase-like activity of phytase family protein [Zavarzinia sp.]|uniref:esterase-like activity of phytase family protein n=1 Tax=Zavarzinia sp. TaxID=2027920 RepID=UPI00356963C6